MDVSSGKNDVGSNSREEPKLTKQRSDECFWKPHYFIGSFSGERDPELFKNLQRLQNFFLRFSKVEISEEYYMINR